jgi:hypothetical protein
MTPYSLAKDVQGEIVSANHTITVSLRTKSKVDHRAIYAGQANCRFWLEQVGKSSTWRFSPTILNPQSLEPEESQTPDGEYITKILLGEISNSSGFLDMHTTGTFRTYAVHFDQAHAYDLWLMVLHRKAIDTRVEIEKDTLSIQDESGQCSAYISVDQTSALDIEVNSSGSGFKKFDIVIKRTLGESFLEDQIGQVAAGSQTLKWRPTVRELDYLLIAKSAFDSELLCDFLKQSFGVNFSYLLHYYTRLSQNFILSDSEDISYEISLKGERGVLRKAISDKAAFRLVSSQG